MKILKGLILICTFSIPTLGLAQSNYKIAQWDFVAPSIYGTSNLTQAASGLIVYDSMTDSFYGKGPAGSSDWRPFSQGAAYVGTNSLGLCGTGTIVDWSQSSVFTVTLTSASMTPPPCLFTFQKMGNGQTITLWITNGPTYGGNGSASWAVGPSGTVKWPAGTPPTITQTVSALDICTFIYNGSVVAGSCVQDLR